MADHSLHETTALKIATNALIETQSMSDSIGVLLDQLISDSVGVMPQYASLQAIKACLMRMDAAVDPASDLLTMRAA